MKSTYLHEAHFSEFPMNYQRFFKFLQRRCKKFQRSLFCSDFIIEDSFSLLNIRVKKMSSSFLGFLMVKLSLKLPSKTEIAEQNANCRAKDLVQLPITDELTLKIHQTNRRGTRYSNVRTKTIWRPIASLFDVKSKGMHINKYMSIIFLAKRKTFNSPFTSKLESKLTSIQGFCGVGFYKWGNVVWAW